MSKRVVGWGLSTVLAALALSAAPANAAVTSISAGFEHTCAVKVGGSPVCWGLNDDGEATPGAVGSLTQVTAGGYHTCAVKTDDTPVCWGDNFLSQITIPAGVDYVNEVSSGFTHSCAIKTDGAPVCWGENGDGQNTVPADASSVTQISAGGHHTCAIRTDGTPSCWGWNLDGQTTVPSDIGTISQISAGLMHTCAVKTGGTPVCWGNHSAGQTTIPVGLDAVTQISAGGLHTCAIKPDERAVCWGSDAAGQSTVPAGLGAVTEISAGFNHTCAVKTSGVAVCWGANDQGQRGTPPSITSGAPPTSVGGGAYSHTVTMTDGTFPSTLAVTGLPPGLGLAGGQITGTPTATGAFTGTITASDGVFADSQNFSITVDITPPVTTDDVPAGPVNHAVTVTLDTTDEGWADVAHTYYTTDGSDPTPASDEYDPAHKPVLHDGQTIKYFSVDTAGNAEDVQTSDPAHVDTTAPTVTISAPVNGGTYTKGRSVLAAYACSDACTGTVAAGAAIDTSSVGKHAFTVVARDAAGNETTKTVTYTVVAPPATVVTPPDTTGPVVTIPGKNKTLVQRKGVVRFTLGKALEPTTGTIALKAKGLKVGSAKFTAANGQVVILKIRLSKKAKKALAKRGKLKAQALITVKDGAGNATVKTFKLTIKR